MEDSETNVLNDGISVQIDTSPNAVQHHIPSCDSSLKPFLGQKFKNIEDGIDFYRNYGKTSGFDIRMGTKKMGPGGIIIRRYVVCHREGDKNSIADDLSSSEKIKRRRVSMRVGCMARIVFKFCGVDGYVVDRFLEGHSHQLVPDEFKKYLKVNKKLGFVHQNFLMSCARANLGHSQSHKFLKAFVGEYSNVGSSVGETKNFYRDLRAYIGGCDAQIMLNKMRLRKESCSAFYYDFSVDKDDNLTSVFWADPIARRNYAVFGDIVSFDCTYRTNKYEMIFAPFTGKDNHGKCVTFGAALMSGENQDCYIWAFERFVDCMGRHPGMIITDQDPAMRIAIKQIFPNTRHRLCMWHIMMKVPEKLPTHLKKDDAFMERLNGVVWSEMNEPSVFEEQWNALMVDFELTDASWFKSLYEIRQYWIPAFFRDHSMSRLCRTTSISESMNHFFNDYLNHGSNLVEFMMHFEIAMDTQRNAHDLQNSLDYSSIPQLETPMLFEKDASTVYTTKQFAKVQEEIKASCYSCSVVNIKEDGDGMLYEVHDGTKTASTVLYNKDEESAVCSCKKFVMDGILCCHIFHLFKFFKWDTIPDKYIVPRWTKEAFLKPLHSVSADVDQCVRFEEKKNIINQLVSDFFACVGAVEGDKEKIKILLGGINDLKAVLISDDTQGSSNSIRKSKLFELFYGSSKSVEIAVNPPLPVKTKGSRNRIKTRIEIIDERANKAKRMCSSCKELSHHDARTCPRKKNK